MSTSGEDGAGEEEIVMEEEEEDTGVGVNLMGEEILGAQDNIWKNDEIELLIETVRINPVLYDIKSKDNKNVGKKELTWLSVSNIVNKDGK